LMHCPYTVFTMLVLIKIVLSDYRNLWIGICGMVLTMGVILWNFSILSPFGYYGRYSQHPNKLKVNISTF
jgi:hypothetical protein